MSPRTPTARAVRRRPISPLGAGRAAVRWTLAATLVLVACASPAEAAWRAPVAGEVVERFDFAPAAPYAGGQHRGVDLAARPGQLVGAPCSGRVTYAGRVPGHGHGVTIACGTYAATVLDLARTHVVRGARTTPGAPVGTAAGTTVHLGARRRGARHGYVDPLRLLGRAAPPPPAAVPPPRPTGLGRAPRAAPAPRPAPLPAPAAHPTPAAAPAPPATTPLTAWLGLALLLTAVPTGALVHHHRRRRTAAVAQEVRT